MNFDLKDVARLRAAVCFLGEKDQYNWWPSTFLSKNGAAFLAPVFTKTLFLSQMRGATLAAQTIHDEAVAAGDRIHLFRLPEHIEHDIDEISFEADILKPCIESSESALEILEELAVGKTKQGTGPLALDEHDDWLQSAAAAYLYAFKINEPVFPYWSSF